MLKPKPESSSRPCRRFDARPVSAWSPAVFPAASLRSTPRTSVLLGAALFLTALAALPVRAQFIVSEVMADPSVLADAQGEFVELANAGDRAESGDSVRLAVDGDTLSLGRLSLAPGEHWLACKDSAAMAAAGVACRKGMPGLGLANSRPLRLAVLWGETRSAFDVPAARAGVSWENTWDEGKGLLVFSRSAAVFLAGDSATPGFRNSRSARPARHDLGLGRAWLERERDGEVLRVRVENLGSEAAAGGLSVRLDRDWDGLAETAVDSVGVAEVGGMGGMGGTGGLGKSGGEVRLALDPDHLGILVVSLSGDENPANDAIRVYRGAGKTLEIGEICPAPPAGPEWAEIRNATGDAGGLGRALELSRVAWRGHGLGPGAGRLLPGERLLLTEDAEALRHHLGPLKVRILAVPGWGALRNTGDTCRLALGGLGGEEPMVLDSLAYGSREASTGACLARPAPSAGAPDSGPRKGPPMAVPEEAPSPGYAAPAAPDRLTLAVSPRILDPGATGEVAVEVPPGAAYGLRVFDLEGNCRRVLARGGAGRHVHGWSGEGERGNRLPPGPYILGLTAGASTVHRTVILAGGQ